MKSPKNRKKSFRVDCINCHSTQHSLQFACSQCQQRLYTNMEEAELQDVAGKVEEMELILTGLESPKKQDKSNPYEPMDKAWVLYRNLRAHSYMPGMPEYLDRILEVLLPIKLQLMKRTVKANWIFLAMLLVFPLVTLIFRMNGMVIGLLALPALVWFLVTMKAANDLKRTQQRLTQIPNT